MRKVYIALLSISLIITSCNSVLENKIESATIETDVKTIKEKYPELDSLKINILENLVKINKGREVYVSDLESRFGDTKISVDKIVLSEERYNEQKQDIFNYFKAQEITYAQLFSEIDTINLINEKYKIEAQAIYKEIDAFCIEQQKDIEENEKKAEEIKTLLNEMVDLKIISIRETEYDYRDLIEVKIQMINKTSKPIEAISFNMELTDKLGNHLATLRCRSNDRFVKSDIGNWTYDKWDQSETYKALRNTKLSHITAKQEISKINHGGKLISAYDISDDLMVMNYDYKSPDNLYGYCPYLKDKDELSLKLEELKSKKDNEIEESTPIISKYQNMTAKLLDFSRMFN